MRFIAKHIHGDRAIWAIVALLSVFSFLPVYSASSNLVYVLGTGSVTGHLIKHVAIVLIGMSIMYAVHRIPFKYDDTDDEIKSALERHNPKSQRIPYTDKKIKDKRFNSIDMIRIDNPSLEGIHNSKNAMAAATIAQLVNIRKQTIRESLQTFKGAPHRLEKVLSILKVDYS